MISFKVNLIALSKLHLYWDLISSHFYAAAFSEGFHASSLINDAPIVFEDKALEEKWRPRNASGRFYGPTRLREDYYRAEI